MHLGNVIGWQTGTYSGQCVWNSNWRWSPDSAPRGPFNGAKRRQFNRNTTRNLNLAWIETAFSTFELTLVAEVFVGFLTNVFLTDQVSVFADDPQRERPPGSAAVAR
jgi:hypothetical protein